ncbi:MAG: hypothetical protein JXX28_16975 [Deltaproteobacteria bacterium]|nr:hypothetical protein [Deltaproteobacteria bacterium]
MIRVAGLLLALVLCACGGPRATWELEVVRGDPAEVGEALGQRLGPRVSVLQEGSSLTVEGPAALMLPERLAPGVLSLWLAPREGCEACVTLRPAATSDERAPVRVRSPALEAALEVVEAAASLDAQGLPVVTVELSPGAAARFAQLTAAHVDQRVALAVDGAVILAPVVRGAVEGGTLSLSLGVGATEAQAARLAEVLRGPPLGGEVVLRKSRPEDE